QPHSLSPIGQQQQQWQLKPLPSLVDHTTVCRPGEDCLSAATSLRSAPRRAQGHSQRVAASEIRCQLPPSPLVRAPSLTPTNPPDSVPASPSQLNSTATLTYN